MGDFIVAIGELGIDILVGGVTRIPSDWSEICKIDHVGVYAAGSAGYFVQCLSRLGEKCRIVGKIGEDRFGDFINKELKNEGVSVEYVKTSSTEETEITVILIFKNGKKIQFVTPIPKLTINDINLDCLENAKHLHFSGYLLFPEMWGKPAEKMLKYAKENGLTTSLDPQASITGEWTSAFDDMLNYVDLLLLDEMEAKNITGCSSIKEASRKLLETGPRIVAVKLGKNGCYVNDGKNEIKAPAYKVDSVSTVGAGDAFDAGFIYGFINNWGLDKTAKFANAVAALSTTKFGCKTGLCNTAHVIKFMTEMESNSISTPLLAN